MVGSQKESKPMSNAKVVTVRTVVVENIRIRVIEVSEPERGRLTCVLHKGDVRHAMARTGWSYARVTSDAWRAVYVTERAAKHFGGTWEAARPCSWHNASNF